jgi:RND family efflux transporter MFP subunit
MRGSKFLPLQILAGAALIVMLLVLARRIPEERPRQNAAPLIRIVVAESTSYRFSVKAFGSVAPRTESDLIPQVSGEILWISPSLAAGGFFEAGEILARIDAADYRVGRETARAVVARTQSNFGRAQKELVRQQRLKDQSVSSESRIDDAVNGFRVAEANLLEARARLERATRDLARTELRAPYRGRVRGKTVDVGQFVTRGQTIARLYSVDVAEIRLPVPDRELAFLDVPLAPRRFASGPLDEKYAGGDRGPLDEGSPVTLMAEFAGRLHHWTGTLVRTEAELDPRTRMVHLVAQVQDPFGLSTDTSTSAASMDLIEGLPRNQTSAKTAPLAVGLFVEAEIQGHTIDHAFVIPRDALHEGDLVYLVDSEDRIQFHNVEVLRMERENAIIGAGLESGDRICSTPLEAAINGMRVRVYEPNSESPKSLTKHEPPVRTDESAETNR